MIENLKKQLECENVKYEDLTFKLYGIFSGDVYERLWIDLPDVWDFNYASLLEGKMAEELETVAPYLVELSSESKHLDAILESYGQNGCVFFCTPLEFEEALERVREIFIVQDENGAEGYLRFYSPDIFRTLIDKHNLEHLQLMFKQIMYYYCEAENDPMMLNRYRYDGKSIQIEELSLDMKSD
ncbi:MAG: DUF4123 domain-containing protein [Cocleimonas sp.]|nr:DUF4123 domain-containing protein [Cocleimonas sp.]